jgi:preprotein translocase subunit YajC
MISLLVLSGCIPSETPAGGEGGFPWQTIILLAVLFGLMYLILIRPQRKKQKEHQQLVSELKRGDKVITAGGIYGQIESVSEDTVVLRIDSNTTAKVAKSSVALRREGSTF